MFCLPDSDVEQAMDVLERMRHALADTPVEATDRTKIAVTASFGVATMDKDTDSEETARRADAALYEAKRTGRNRVCAWSAETASKGDDVP